MKKRIALLLIFICTYAHAEVQAPLQICSHIKENVAYETMKITKQKCDPTGIKMSEKQLYRAYMNMLSDNEASPSECNTNCLVTGALNKQSMKECVSSYAKTFAKTIAKGSFTASTCSSFKSRFVE